MNIAIGLNRYLRNSVQSFRHNRNSRHVQAWNARECGNDTEVCLQLCHFPFSILMEKLVFGYIVQLLF